MNIVTLLVAIAGALLGAAITMRFLQWKVDRDYKTQLKADQEYAARLRKLRQPPPSMDERRNIFKEQLKSKSPPARNFIGQDKL